MKTIKEELKLNKMIALLLLALLVVFLALKHDALDTDDFFYNGVKGKPDSEIDPPVFADVTESDTVTQDFVALERSVKGVTLCFNNPHGYETDGTVTVILSDSEGNELGKATNNSNIIRSNNDIYFYFNADASLKNTSRLLRTENAHNEDKIEGVKIDKGETYTLTILFDGIKESDDFQIYLGEKEDPAGGSWTSQNNSELTGNVLYGSIIYRQFNMRTFTLLLLVILAAMIFILLPRESLAKKKTENSKKSGKKTEKQTDIDGLLQQLMLLATPFLCCWLTLKIAGRSTASIIRFMLSMKGLMNLAIAVCIVALLFAITNSGKAASIISALAAYLLSATCYALILFRNVPLRASDIIDVGTAMDVASNYSLQINKSFVWITVVTVCFIAMALSLKRSRRMDRKTRLIVLVVAIAMSAGTMAFINDSTNIKEYDLRINAFHPTSSYKKMGYILAFTGSFRDLHIDKPKGYSTAEVQRITEGFTSDEGVPSATVSEQTPNVIVVMNEAFSDLSVLGELETNEPYMPFFDGLTENAVKGTMYTSVFGGGTANTEYEFLTGNTIAFLRFKTAYTTLINGDIPSLCRTLEDQGYRGLTAFHPGKTDSYSRDKVYPRMGFRDFISLADLEDPKRIRAFVSDEGVYEEVFREYEEYKKSEEGDSPFFMFNVTIQNHSSFSYDTGVVDAGIEIKDNNLNTEEASQYLNLIKKSDEAFEELIEYFENVDEPTVIVMFGDHQPKLEEEFYNEMMNRMDSGDSSIQKRVREYQVPFIIWANYDIEEESDVILGANMLGPYMLQKLGLRMTGYDKYLMAMRDELPVVTGLCTIDSEGTLRAIKREDVGNQEHGDTLLDYQKIEYCNIKGDRDEIKDFFYLK